MINRAHKLRWRRRFRRSRQHVEGLSVQTEEGLDKHLFRRLSRLYGVRRFISAWLLLSAALITGVILQTRALSSYYQILRPVSGGTYREGIIGSFTNANPLYAAGGVNGAVSRLVFSSLVTYDQQNQLVGDLAKSWEVDDTGLRYTVHLRDNVTWHDGQKLTAEDVIFTYNTIQNPDARSTLQSSWSGIKFEQPDDYTVIFILPSVLSSFPYALTNGIVPKHILDNIPVAQLRSVSFNTTNPVGSGPFKWDVLEVEGSTTDNRQERIGLVAYDGYFLGAPKLQQFVIRSFRDDQPMIDSYKQGEIDGMVGLTSIVDAVDTIPEGHEYNIPLTGEIMVFFKTSQEVLSDQRVRQALVQSINTDQIINGLDHSVVEARGPLLRSQLGYDESITQLPYDVNAANGLLDAAGWPVGPEGIRLKDGKRLTFTLHAQSIGEYAYVTQQLQEQWRKVGVDADVKLLDDNELQNLVALHGYEALLYGISLGNDPDVFAYWHSSQADPRASTRLNLSEYKSGAADRALESGRTRADADLRAAKYKPFLEAWRNDAPALALYQPRFLYVTRDKIAGFDPQLMNNATERFSNVHNWMTRKEKTNI